MDGTATGAQGQGGVARVGVRSLRETAPKSHLNVVAPDLPGLTLAPRSDPANYPRVCKGGSLGGSPGDAGDLTDPMMYFADLGVQTPSLPPLIRELRSMQLVFVSVNGINDSSVLPENSHCPK